MSTYCDEADVAYIDGARFPISVTTPVRHRLARTPRLAPTPPSVSALAAVAARRRVERPGAD